MRKSTRQTIDPVLQRAIEIAGSRGALARKIGCSRQNIGQWLHVPAEQVLAVEKATGLSRETLRPDLYDQPRPKKHKVA